MENEMPVFVSLECSFFHEILLLMFLVTQVLFVCIIFQYCKRLVLWNTMNMLFVCVMDVGFAKYNVIHCGKYKIVLLDACLLYLYFPPELVEQYSGNYHKNVTHISSVVAHDF